MYLSLTSSIPIVSTLSRVGGGGLAGLDDLTGYAGGKFMFVVGPPKPDRP